MAMFALGDVIQAASPLIVAGSVKSVSDYYSSQDIDWSNRNAKGETFLDHIQKHNSPNYKRKIHGVFNDDGQTMVEIAWANLYIFSFIVI